MSTVEDAKKLKKEAMLLYHKGEFLKAIEKLQKAKNIIEKYANMTPLSDMKEVYNKIVIHYSALIDKISIEKKVRVPGKRRSGPRTRKGKVEGFPIEIDDITCKDFIIKLKEFHDFQSIAGLEEVKQQLRENIEYPLKYPDLIEKYGIKISSGILMYGPPGCGKSFIISCASGEFNIPIFRVSGSTILSKYVGESPKLINELYDCAHNYYPSIVFIDEIDKLITSKDTSGVIVQVQSELQQILSGVGSGEDIVTVAATNCPWDLDPALIRKGRLGKIIYVPPPNDEVRKQLFELNLSQITSQLTSDVSIKKLVEKTKPVNGWHYAGSDITSICDEVKWEAVRKEKEGITNVKISLKMFEKAIKEIHPSISPKQISAYKKWRDRVKENL